MTEKEKGQTSSHTPSTIKNNTGAKVQNIPDTHKDISIVLDYFRCISGTSLDCSLSTGILRNSDNCTNLGFCHRAGSAL